MTPAERLVTSLPRVSLVVGKGGVGKTTCASALALLSSRSGETLVLTTDPARALPAVLECDVGAEPTPVRGTTGLFAQYIDVSARRERFMARHGAEIRAILDRGTYLDDADIAPLVDSALPGGDEIFAALELAELLTGSTRFARVVIDTAPTGHTLRLLDLPQTLRALVQLLESMQAKHRFMVRALARTYRADEADRFLAEMHEQMASLERTLTDAGACRAIVVTNDEPVVLAESRRLIDALETRRIAVGAVIWNGSAAASQLGSAPQYRVDRLAEFPVGVAGLQRWLSALKPATGHRATARVRKKARSEPPGGDLEMLAGIVRPLTIVAGKGGVGKTSVAATLGIAAAQRHRTLVVSTDPAPSLADALGQDVPDADTAIGGLPTLYARQLDATAAFAAMRTQYQERIDAIFDGLISRGMNPAHDRAIARDLLALAPPGVDEVYALSLLADTLASRQYERLVVDPAPTGHLIRMFEMPQLALSWTHQLMRLMLKYKEVVALGETAKDLLAFSQGLRAIDSQLRDASQSAVVLVTLNEPVVRGETERLAREVERLGVGLGAVVMNRSVPGAPLPVPQAPVHLVAPTTATGPVGIGALWRWGASWIVP